MPWDIQKKITLPSVTVLFLFTFFNLILDAPRTYNRLAESIPPELIPGLLTRLDISMDIFGEEGSKEHCTHGLFVKVGSSPSSTFMLEFLHLSFLCGRYIGTFLFYSLEPNLTMSVVFFLNSVLPPLIKVNT